MNPSATLKDKIYDAVYADVLEGIYRPNDILTESSLIEKYGVSKSPVREALIELCKDNVLKSIPRTGYQLVNVTLKELRDILDFRISLEVAQLRKAYGTITQANLQDLEEKASAAQDKNDEHQVLPNWERNQLFHLSLCKLSDNEYAYSVLRETLKKCSRYVSVYFFCAWGHETETRGMYHQVIVEALKNQDLELACETLTKDILRVREEVQDYME